MLEEEKPFRLAESLSLVFGMLLIFAASLTLAAVVSRQAELIITKRATDDTIKLMEHLNNQLLYDFQLEVLARFGRIHLSEPEQVEILEKVISKTTYGFDVKRIQIYDLNGNVVYSTEIPRESLPVLADDMESYLKAIRLEGYPNIVGDKETDRRELDDSALKEANEDDLVKQARPLIVQKLEGGRHLLWSFFPEGDFVLRSYKAMAFRTWMMGNKPVIGGVWDSVPDEMSINPQGDRFLTGVLELSRDFSSEYRQIARLQYFALGVAVILSFILVVILRSIVSRGEALINKRNKERQVLQERLGQSERLAGLGSMVATVAHEIRNPLGIIHSTADLLCRFLKDQPNEAKLAGSILEEADRLSEVVTEFLDFARPRTPKLQEVVVEDLLEEILAFLEVTLVRNGIEVRTSFNPHPLPVLIDSSMMHRAFLNILVNAIQAMDGGGLLSISTRFVGDFVEISIEDTGPGLSEEAAKKIFSPFYTTKAKGSGLGLVIVRNIIDAHEGEIELVSGEGQGHCEDGCGPGLKVIIRLPRIL